jgi:hypothetical protein
MPTTEQPTPAAPSLADVLATLHERATHYTRQAAWYHAGQGCSYTKRATEYATNAERLLREVTGALRAVGITRSDEYGDDGSEWVVALEPRGEEPVGSLEDALRALLAASAPEPA